MPIFALRHLLPAAALGLFLALPAQADDYAGSYLAARVAIAEKDFPAVVEYGTRAVALAPDNADLIQGLLIAQVGIGQFDAAVPVARRLSALEPENQLAGLVVITDAIRAGRWQQVLGLLEQGVSVGGSVDQLVRGWAYFGLGDAQKGAEAFQALERDGDPGQFGIFHHALALAQSGDYFAAVDVLKASDARALRLDRESAIAYAQMLSMAERPQDAVKLLESVFGDGGSPAIRTLRAELAAGKPVPLSVLNTPQKALSAVYAKIAQAVAQELNPEVVLLYSRAAEFIDPDNQAALFLSASLLETLQLYDLAIATYSRIPADSPLYRSAMIAKAAAMRHAGDSDAAIAALEALAQQFPDAPRVFQTLGDNYRFAKRCKDALAPYDRAVSLIGTPSSAAWRLFFARGVCNERVGNWEQAEADFLKALELEPDQPSVLNYLGYSWVEQQRNLDRALDMIKRAVEARPEDGYIVDSLGWVYYRLGRYDEALSVMERAVELVPVDPVLNDHLGDVYWAVGRRLEAEFQWRRALSFITDDTDLDEVKPDRIRRKLEVGLDRVLEEEGAPPLHATDEGG